MREFSNKKKLKKILYSKLSILLLLIVFFFVVRASFRVFEKQADSYDKKVQAGAELAAIETREETLKGDIERLNTSQGIEEEIREKFKMAKEDENLVIIVDEQEKKSAPEEKPGFLQSVIIQVRNFFKKI